MTQRWHIAFTDSRAEQDTCEEIHGLGYEAFCPTERHKRFKNGKKTITETALFPRYIFTSFSQSDNWPEILDCDGVCDILRNNGQPSSVPDPIVPKLKRMQQLGLFDHTKAPNPFPPGTTVILDDDGPFAELIGKVMRVRTGDRVDLLINYLNREMMVNVSLARLSHI